MIIKVVAKQVIEFVPHLRSLALQRPQKLSLIILFLFLVLTSHYLVLVFCIALAATRTPDASFLETQARLFNIWLQDTGLSDEISVIKVRFARHPNPDIERKIYRLELRKTPIGESAADNLGYFEALNNRFLDITHSSLHEKIFQKFVHILGVSAGDVSSHIHVGETDFMTYLGTEEWPITIDSNTKMIHREAVIASSIKPTLDIPPLTRKEHKRLPVQSPIKTEDIKKFFEEYYKIKSAKVEVIDITNRRLQLHINHLKGQIISNENFWEDLEISIYLDRQQNDTILDLHFDGNFAPGLGDMPPKDGTFKSMEPKFSKRLNEYGGMLIVELKSHLTKQ